MDVKTRRAMEVYESKGGFTGRRTVNAVLRGVPAELKERLSCEDVGLVMAAVNAAYHRGRDSHGGLDLCDDCVWLPWGGLHGEGQLVPIEALKSITKTTADGEDRYAMDYVEPRATPTPVPSSDCEK